MGSSRWSLKKMIWWLIFNREKRHSGWVFEKKRSNLMRKGIDYWRKKWAIFQRTCIDASKDRVKLVWASQWQSTRIWAGRWAWRTRPAISSWLPSPTTGHWSTSNLCFYTRSTTPAPQRVGKNCYWRPLSSVGTSGFKQQYSNDGINVQ